MSEYNYADFNNTLNTDLNIGPDVNTNINPQIDTEISKPSSGSNVGKIILIVILSILIIVSIVFIFIFRNNLITAESNENPSCPQLNCNVNDPNYVADPDCGASAFRFNSSGKKICSNSRYS